MKYTEEQLKVALVRAIPDKLSFHNNKPVWYYGYVTQLVTKREWTHIVATIKQKLKLKQRIRFGQHLVNSVSGNEEFAELFVTWRDEAQILADIGAIKVKEESK